jgi:hypothetical protein
MFLIAIDSYAPTLDNPQDIQVQDFEQQGKCPWHLLYLFHVSFYRIAC